MANYYIHFLENVNYNNQNTFSYNKLEKMAFDFTKICYHGGYFSTYSPSTLSQYQDEIFIPDQSRYHLIGIYLPNFIKSINTWTIVQKYTIYSKFNRTVIIDICLPYYDTSSHRKYLGRFIIHKGSLLAVKLSHSANSQNQSYSIWPRHKVKSVKLPPGFQNQNGQDSYLIGQFSLKLNNIRVGLLYQHELSSSTIEYLSYSYQIILITRSQISRDVLYQQKKKQLSRQSFLIQVDVGCSNNLIDKSTIEELILNERIRLQTKNQIYLDYYNFNHLVSKKAYFQINQKNMCQIAEILINFNMNHKQKQNYQEKQNKKKIVSKLDHKYNNNCSNLILIKDNELNIFFKRIFKLFYRANKGKLIISLEQNPATICFLYVFRQFLYLLESSDQIKANKIILNDLGYFELIEYQFPKINKIAHDLQFKKSKTKNQCDEQANIQLSNQYILHKLQQIINQNEQSYFPLLTSSPIVVNIVKMLNQLANLAISDSKEAQESSEICQISKIQDQKLMLKTIICAEIFNKDQIRQLYYSPSIRSLVNDNKYHQKLWNIYQKQIKAAQSISRLTEIVDYNMPNSSLKQIMNRHNLEEVVQSQNSFTYLFTLFYRSVRPIEASKSKVFSHYFFRSIPKLSFCPTLKIDQDNYFEDMLLVQQQEFFDTFKLLTSRNMNFLHQFQHKTFLKRIANARLEQQQKVACHKCQIKYNYLLLYKCQQQKCLESFCYQCLYEFYGFQVKKLISLNGNESSTNSFRTKRKLKNCPICLNQCDEKTCRKCEKQKNDLKIILQEQKLQNKKECHSCLSLYGSILIYKCYQTECKRVFCHSCIINIYNDQTKNYQMKNWACYVCSNQCYCNSCEAQKHNFLRIIKYSQNYQQKSETPFQQKKSVQIIMNNNLHLEPQIHGEKGTNNQNKQVFNIIKSNQPQSYQPLWNQKLNNENKKNFEYQKVDKKRNKAKIDEIQPTKIDDYAKIQITEKQQRNKTFIKQAIQNDQKEPFNNDRCNSLHLLKSFPVQDKKEETFGFKMISSSIQKKKIFSNIGNENIGREFDY